MNYISKLKDKQYKEMLIDALCQGVKNTSEFRDSINYIIDNKIHIFDSKEFNGKLYQDEEDYISLVLPSFRRAWSLVYINPPTLFKSQERIDFFRLNFDIDEFIDYLKDIFIKTKGCLGDFEYIDRTPKHLEIIVDNYISLLVKRVIDCDDYKLESRNLKLKKLKK
jgi:hypothetical protein